MAGANDVKNIYKQVVTEVCNAVREALLEEGYDDHTLQELKTLWSARLESSKALEPVQTSAVDESTTRNHRHTTNESHPANFNKKMNNGSRIQQFHQASASAINNSTGPIPIPIHNVTPTASNNINLVASNSQNFQRASQISRQPYNTSTIVQNPMKTSNQLDGSNDECNSSKVNSLRSKERKKPKRFQISFQIDGTGPNMTDDEDDDDDNEMEGNEVGDDLDDDEDEEGNEEGKEDPKPLCSDDDISGDEASELFDTENVVVCQYEKISRTKSKWRFTLKSGVMNINGKDYVFSKAMGEAEW